MPPYYRFTLTPSFLGHLFKAGCRQRFGHLRPLFARFIPPEGVVLDIGANAGQFSKLFASLAPRGQVFAFEPAAYARLVLGLGLLLTRRRNVTVIPAGLAATAGCEVLYTPLKRRHSLGFGHSHITVEPGEKRTLREIIALLTLDEFAEKTGLQRLDFIKADVEGWELHMLQGGRRTLARFRPPMMIELHAPYLARAGHSLQQAWDFLLELGYAPHIRTAGGVLEKLAAPRSDDIWWLPEGKAA